MSFNWGENGRISIRRAIVSIFVEGGHNLNADNVKLDRYGVYARLGELRGITSLECNT